MITSILLQIFKRYQTDSTGSRRGNKRKTQNQRGKEIFIWMPLVNVTWGNKWCTCFWVNSRAPQLSSRIYLLNNSHQTSTKSE